jgi:hypothetical protein
MSGATQTGGRVGEDEAALTWRAVGAEEPDPNQMGGFVLRFVVDRLVGAKVESRIGAEVPLTPVVDRLVGVKVEIRIGAEVPLKPVGAGVRKRVGETAGSTVEGCSPSEAGAKVENRVGAEVPLKPVGAGVGTVGRKAVRLGDAVVMLRLVLEGDVLAWRRSTTWFAGIKRMSCMSVTTRGKAAAGKAAAAAMRIETMMIEDIELFQLTK